MSHLPSKLGYGAEKAFFFVDGDNCSLSDKLCNFLLQCLSLFGIHVHWHWVAVCLEFQAMNDVTEQPCTFLPHFTPLLAPEKEVL